MAKAPADTETRAQDDLSEEFWGRTNLRTERRSQARSTTATREAQRRARSPRRQRGRTLLALILVGVLISAAIGAGWWWRSRDSRRSAASSTVSVAESTPMQAVPLVAPTQPAAVIAHQRADSKLDFVSVVGTDKVGQRSAVIFVPVATQVEVPANGLQQVSELQRLGGLPLLDLSMRNTLGVATDRSAVIDDAVLQTMFEPAGPLLISLRQPLTIANPPLQLAAGTQSLTPAQAAALVVGTPTGMTELDRLDVVRAVFVAWLDALRAGDRAAATVQRVPAAAAWVTAAKASAQVETMPVVGIGLGADERYQVRTSELTTFMERALPDALYRTGSRPRIEIRGSSEPEMLAASACIIRAGGNIRLTGRGEPADTTSVVFYRERGVETAKQMLAALGAGSLKRADRDLDLVDVTVEVGKDFNGCS